MNTKNKLIEKLLKVAKKHKILTYPVLAFVAIISFVSYFFSWRNGAGKRVVAVVMALVMLVSQSYFLTSSATTREDDANSSLIQEELQNDKLVSSDSSNNLENVLDLEETNGDTSTSTESDGTIVGDTISSSETTLPEASEAKDEKSTEVSNKGSDIQSENLSDVSTENANTVELYFYYTMDGQSKTLITNSKIAENKEYNVTELASQALDLAKKSIEEKKCYKFEGWYYDLACKEKVEDLSKVPAKENNGKSIMLYCKAILVKYQVKVVKAEQQDDSITFTTNPEADSPGVYYIPASEETGEKKGTFTISNITRKGYTVTGADVSGGAATVSNGDAANSFIVTLTGDELKRTVTLKWKANSYKIQYAKNEAGEIVKQQDVTYDSQEDKFLSGEGIAEKKDGHKFAGWKIAGTETIVQPNSLISEKQEKLYPKRLPQEEEAIKTLYPVYTYDGVEINTNEINYEYKKSEETIFIQGRYKGSDAYGHKNFQYQIKSGAEALGEYGVTVDDSSNGVTFKTNEGGPTKKTGAEGVTVEFTITDATAPRDQQETTHSVTVHVAPRVVIAKAEKDTRKAYDKTTKAFITSPLQTNINGVTVSFTGSCYNSENVKDANQIFLDSTQIHVPEGEDSNNYVLSTNDGKCSIEGAISPRPVYLKTFSVDKQSIRAGEQSPQFGVKENTDEIYGSGLLEGDTIATLGEIQYSTDRPSDLTVPGEYKISAAVATTSNYKVIVNDVDKGSFKVIKENPEENVNYTISGTKGNNDWYIKNPAQIEPVEVDQYDTIRISKNGSTIASYGEIVNLSEMDYPKNSDIYIQLYDSKTGAVTSWKQIYLKLDQTAPEYDSYVLKQGENKLYESKPVTGGLYFPTKGMVTFGNYFNQTVNISIKYKDTTSGLSTLHYGLYGEDAGTRSTLFTSTNEEGYATATFEVLKEVVDKSGIIKYYAEDSAGNNGEQYELVRDSASEWSVETSGPNVESYIVKAGEDQLKTVVSGSKEYYSNCTASLTVTDDVSGIYSVTWVVNDVIGQEERIINTSAKQTEWIFTKDINAKDFPCETGEYSVYAIVKDNAQNEITTDSINFKVDDQMPEINITSDYDKWLPSVKLSFNTLDDLSGIKYVNVTDENGDLIKHNIEKVENGITYCYFETTTKGDYHIIVSDKADNVNEKVVTLDKVSKEIPDCPEVTISPEDALGNGGWYTEVPSFTIQNITKTKDETPVATKYQLWKEGDTPYNATSIPSTDITYTKEIPGEGEYNLKVWTESVTGITCADAHEYKFIVDTTAPDIQYTTTKGSGSTITVDFTITDEASGVDHEKIEVLHGSNPIMVKVEEVEKGYKGSFEIKETGTYSISASDLAGNLSDAAAFTPMSMKIKAVTNITESGVVLGADVLKGTFDITSTTLSYRKISDTTFTEVEAITTKDENGNVSISAILEDLEKETNYAFKVVAVSDADEVLEYEGYFKTISLDAKGIPVKGTVKYPEEKDAMVTVALFDGSVCIMAKEIKAGEEFVFENVADGNYNIVATDGKHKKTVRVLVKDGAIQYPENYIEIIFSGINTSVEVVTADTPKISVDNMDSIFEDDTINITDEDRLLMQSGGTVEFKLYASLMRVTDISSEEISAMYMVTDSNKVVGAYLDLSLYKIASTVNGETNHTRVSNLASGANLSITIPLEDLAGKPGLEVVRIHNTGDKFVGRSLVDQDTNPNTYTIITNQFSTYAILYNAESKTEEQTTEEITTEASSTQQVTTEEVKEEVTDTTEEEKTEEDQNSSVSSLTSSGSAQTGDATPIAFIMFMMLLSLGGYLILRKNLKE